MRVALVTALISASFLANCVSSSVVSEQPSTLTRSQINQVQETVKYGLIDPDSASFRNVRAIDMKLADGTTYKSVCGEVNSKNRMGGYVGFTPFKGHMESSQFKLDYVDGPGSFTASMACRNR